MAKKKTCQTCDTKDKTVETMPDPFTAALYPDEEHEQMTLCPPCAVARYEES